MSAKSQPIHHDLRNALALLGDIPADAITAKECWKAVAPKCPTGFAYAKRSFWSVIQTPVLIRRTRISGIVDYIHRQKKIAESRGKPWPPKALFVPFRAAPYPWDGKR